ncbi:hypothetical protein ACWDBD_17165 [Streptomyces sp. NPDC001118]
MSDPTPDYASAWADLSGYVDQAVEDGKPIDPKILRAYMQQLRRKAMNPPRDWRAGILARRIGEP